MIGEKKQIFILKRKLFLIQVAILFCWGMAFIDSLLGESLPKYLMAVLLIATLWIEYDFLFKVVRKVVFDESGVTLFYMSKTRHIAFCEVESVVLSTKEITTFVGKNRIFYWMYIAVGKRPGKYALHTENREDYDEMCYLLKNNGCLK